WSRQTSAAAAAPPRRRVQPAIPAVRWGDCHAPLPCEMRKGDDTTPRACSLFKEGRMLVAFTSVVGLNCTTLTASFLPPSRPRASAHSRAPRGVAVQRCRPDQRLIFLSLAVACQASRAVRPRGLAGVATCEGRLIGNLRDGST